MNATIKKQITIEAPTYHRGRREKLTSHLVVKHKLEYQPLDKETICEAFDN